MRTFALLSATALAALLVAGPAAAQKFKFAPPGAAFTATGPADMTKGTTDLKCTATMGVRTNQKGVLKVTSLRFSGQGECPVASALPWKGKGAGFNSGRLIDVALSSSLGNCSTHIFPIFLSGGALIMSFQFPDCGAGFGAQLATSPTLSLVPK